MFPSFPTGAAADPYLYYLPVLIETYQLFLTRLR